MGAVTVLEGGVGLANIMVISVLERRRAIAVTGGIGVAMAVGVLAGIHPATRASRLAPADAFRTT